ncbi:MAG: hypothetical protein J0L82_08435 [Deltaproteobacteria bacterium]|jgi:hypothetical protein|nr:hypothetical protein [Deltaproteobacteria bacterium]
MIRQLVPTSASVTTNVGAHVRKIILSASLLLQITAGPIVLAQFEYEVKERTISRADGTTRPLDLSPETIRRAVRAVEAERASFHQDHSGRRPGVDGPWASGSERARNARIAALRVMTIDANDKATCRRVAVSPCRPRNRELRCSSGSRGGRS